MKYLALIVHHPVLSAVAAIAAFNIIVVVVLACTAGRRGREDMKRVADARAARQRLEQFPIEIDRGRHGRN